MWPHSRGHTGPQLRGQTTSRRTMMMMNHNTGTTPGHGQPVSCKRQFLHALTSPSQCSRFQWLNWPPQNSHWSCSAKWPIPSLASKTNCSNTATWSPIPRHGPHGPTLNTASSLDGLHKKCPAKWREQTWSSLSQWTGYQGQGQRMLHTASSLA